MSRTPGGCLPAIGGATTRHWTMQCHTRRFSNSPPEARHPRRSVCRARGTNRWGPAGAPTGCRTLSCGRDREPGFCGQSPFDAVADGRLMKQPTGTRRESWEVAVWQWQWRQPGAVSCPEQLRIGGRRRAAALSRRQAPQRRVFQRSPCLSRIEGPATGTPTFSRAVQATHTQVRSYTDSRVRPRPDRPKHQTSVCHVTRHLTARASTSCRAGVTRQRS